MTFSGALAWPYLYPWPQRPPGLIEAAFDELGQALEADPRRLRRRTASTSATRSIPGEDLFDGATFEMFLERVGDHPRCGINYDPSHFVLQQLDYLDFIDIYHERINAFHVKDAEFNPTGRQGVYSGFQSWVEPRRPLPLARRRAGRFRRHLLQARAVRLRLLGGARMGMRAQASRGRRAPKARRSSSSHIIRVTEKAFDDFAGGATDVKANKQALGI